ncbi:MAG TPA: RecX family transcriptional regulator [Sphingobacteriaceae bacterium]|nr:RecX family transcriptional regulator [Sphingobacteriaceae bacterium]
MKGSKKVTDKQEARVKAEHYCAYQERSQQEVRTKLQSFDLPYADIEELISELIQANFLNEERFARTYALGKFRIKNWGKNKIKQGLKLKQVPEKLIMKVLKQLDEQDYSHTLLVLLNKKAALLQEYDTFKRNYKLMQYALGKGYERDLITDVLKEL